MKSTGYTIVLFLVILISTAGKAQTDTRRLTIYVPGSGFFVHFLKDGSVTAQYGSNDGDRMCLKAGTIDFPAFFNMLETTERGNHGPSTAFQIALSNQPQEMTIAYFLKDESGLKNLFSSFDGKWDNCSGFSTWPDSTIMNQRIIPRQ